MNYVQYMENIDPRSLMAFLLIFLVVDVVAMFATLKAGSDEDDRMGIDDFFPDEWE